ncbi:IS630 family transposase [Streptomyces chryseus]
MDEAGFSPTLPTGYTWARLGTRAVVYQEGICGRRVNALGALRVDGPDPQLAFHTTTGKITAEVLPDFLCTHVAGLPAGRDGLTAGMPPGRPTRPRTVVLDNATAHVSRVVKNARSLLEAHGVTLFYLPPYSPELNKIERVWRSVKYEDIPIRAYPWIEELQAAVDQALTHRNTQLQTTAHDLRKTTY